MKQFGQFLLLAILISMMGGKAFAHDIEEKNADGVTIYYKWINNKTELAVSYRGGDYTFYDEYSGIVVIPECVEYNGSTYSVTSIDNDAFRDCISLTSVTIGNNVTDIGMSAFQKCISLTSVTISNSVTNISNVAFYGCSGLTSITIPSSVTFIGLHVFCGCSDLISINVEEDNPVFDSRDNCNAIVQTANNWLIIGCKSTIIPNSVTSIAMDAFRSCTGLTSVTIPNSVKSIAGNAFRYCTGLTSVTIPNSVAGIGEYAFGGCSGLTSITIPSSVIHINETAFSGCSGLTSIKVEEGSTIYDSRDYCNAIIKTAENELVSGCQNTIIPNSVISIGTYAFEDCSSLTSLTIPNSVLSIGYMAFRGCSGLTSLTIPNSVISIGSYAFRDCSSLTSLTIPNSVTSIGDAAFRECISLTSLTIPNSVISIGSGAFRGCSGLTSLTIPNSVTSIGSGAFSGCSGLVSVTIPNSVISIDGGVFSDCSGLTSVTIPNSVTSIGNNTFRDCCSLTSITIPNSVTSIGNSAFSGCSSLTSIIIPNSVASIGYDAFRECISLTSVTIPNSVTSIGSYTFAYCSGLTSVTIPNSVTSIGNGAFGNCNNLTSVSIYKATPPNISFDTFINRANAILYVPIGSKASYETADYWKDFKEIVEIDMDMPAVNYVDLGLPSGLLWATCNLGADRPEQFGNYYDWVNNPVQESWDNVWRTPTKAERDELVQYCTYSLETINGVQGAKYTGSNGQSIFFPFAGYYQSGYGPYKVGVGGQYWTTTEYSSKEHWIIATNNPIQTDDNGYYWPLNYFGFPVRPVTSVRPNIIGDANGDGNVDESDINAIADYIVKGKTEGLNLKNADANGDQKVNVADIVRIINRIKK